MSVCSSGGIQSGARATVGANTGGIAAGRAYCTAVNHGGGGGGTTYVVLVLLDDR
jgi:hypothetical protein